MFELEKFCSPIFTIDDRNPRKLEQKSSQNRLSTETITLLSNLGVKCSRKRANGPTKRLAKENMASETKEQNRNIRQLIHVTYGTV